MGIRQKRQIKNHAKLTSYTVHCIVIYFIVAFYFYIILHCYIRLLYDEKYSLPQPAEGYCSVARESFPATVWVAVPLSHCAAATKPEIHIDNFEQTNTITHKQLCTHS